MFSLWLFYNVVFLTLYYYYYFVSFTSPRPCFAGGFLDDFFLLFDILISIISFVRHSI